MRVRFTPDARIAAREKQAWWEQHREKAPQLFAVELADLMAKLRSGDDHERQKYAARGGHIIWRILMPRTRNHVYYRLDQAAREVEVLMIWNAVAGAGPEL